MDPAADCPSVMNTIEPLPLPLDSVIMQLAILELRNADGDRLGALAGQFFHLLQFLAQLLRVLDLGDEVLRHVLVAVEKMEQLLATRLTSSERISVLPSLFLVWDSNTGSFRRMATAPTMYSRTSSPSYLPLAIR